MLKHLSSQKQKNYSYCVNEFKEFKDEEEKKEEEKKENICSQYCDIVKKLITDSETQITCANEIIIDDSFIQLLSNLNHHTPKVKNK